MKTVNLSMHIKKRRSGRRFAVWAAGKIVGIVGLLVWLGLVQPLVDSNLGMDAAYAQENPGRQTFVLLATNDAAQLDQLKQFIMERGGRVTHTFPHQALIANLPDGVDAGVKSFSGVVWATTGPVNLSEADVYGPYARRLAGIWNNLLTPPTESDLGLLSTEQVTPYDDALTPPDLPPDGGLGVSGTDVTPGYYQTSEFMAGTVAVGIILVESDGSIDPSTEDWTEDEKQLVFSEVVSALNWWANRESRANLSFVYDDHTVNPLPTGVEPISRPYYDQQYWIADAMKALGYQGSSYFTSVRDYNNALRSTYQTDWAFTIFVVDSSNDADNYFSNGYFAYAYLGGSFLVMTYGNNGYGPTNMDAVAAHEVGHIFYALDQYYSAAQPCDRRSGYLYVENQNSLYGGCSSNVDSIMRGLISPYTNAAVDFYAAGQIGWWESDGDNILDPLDTELPVVISAVTSDGKRATVSGSASITPFPSSFPYHPSITINRLTGVQYRLDGGSWQQALAVDGSFDSTDEQFQLVIDPVEPGVHALEIAATDSAGNISEVYATETIIGMDEIDSELNTVLLLPDGSVSSQSTIVNGVSYAVGRVIASVKYRVNGGPWQDATPQDGAFDSNYEPFYFTLDALPPGTYTVEALATDTVGYQEQQAATQQVVVNQTETYSLFLPLIIGGM